MSRTFDWRTFGLIAGATLIGAAWAAFNLARAGGNGLGGASSPLVWAIFATPFGTFWGWLAVRRRDGWRAVFVCGAVYFFTILIAARIERLLLGADAATDQGHALYFQLTLVLQLIGGLLIAAHRSRERGTISPIH